MAVPPGRRRDAERRLTGRSAWRTMSGLIFNARRTFVLNQLTITELVPKLATREVSARAVMQGCLDQIQRVDPKLHAFISYDAADALAQADAADKALAEGVTHAERPLLGVPIGVKDVIAVKGQP